MDLSGKEVRFFLDNKLINQFVINDDKLFDLIIYDKICKAIRFDKSAFNVSCNNQLYGILRESSNNRFNLIVNNKVIGFILIN